MRVCRPEVRRRSRKAQRRQVRGSVSREAFDVGHDQLESGAASKACPTCSSAGGRNASRTCGPSRFRSRADPRRPRQANGCSDGGLGERRDCLAPAAEHDHLPPPHYKRWSLKFWTHIYSGVPTDVFAHEFAHNMGLDDEYNGQPGPIQRVRGVHQERLHHCDGDGFTEARNGAKAVYAWIATRRYGVAEAPQCKQKLTATRGCYRAKHGLARNACEERRGPCDACSADDQREPARRCTATRWSLRPARVGRRGRRLLRQRSVKVAGKCSGDNVCEMRTTTGSVPPGCTAPSPPSQRTRARRKPASVALCSNDGECKSGKCATGRCVMPLRRRRRRRPP